MPRSRRAAQRRLSPLQFLVEEVAGTGQGNYHASSLSRLDNFLVADRTARVHDARTPASSSTCRPSAKGKNASDAATATAARSLPSPPRCSRAPPSLQSPRGSPGPCRCPRRHSLSASRIALDLGNAVRATRTRGRAGLPRQPPTGNQGPILASSPSACRGRSSLLEECATGNGTVLDGLAGKFSGRTSRRRVLLLA